MYETPEDPDESDEDEDDADAEDDAEADDDAEGQNFRSTARIRGLLETVVNKVINKSQTNLVSSGQVKSSKII